MLGTVPTVDTRTALCTGFAGNGDKHTTRQKTLRWSMAFIVRPITFGGIKTLNTVQVWAWATLASESTPDNIN